MSAPCRMMLDSHSGMERSRVQLDAKCLNHFENGIKSWCSVPGESFGKPSDSCLHAGTCAYIPQTVNLFRKRSCLADFYHQFVL